MAIKTIDDTHLKQIANAIREKTGSAGGISVNEMPEQIKGIKGGADLPELENEGSASDLLSGKELIDDEGNVVTGTFTIDSELSTQDNLIAQIQSALEGKAAGGGGEDLTAVLNQQAEIITQLEAALENAASGGSGGGGSVETCTVTITNEADAGWNGSDTLQIIATVLEADGTMMPFYTELALGSIDIRNIVCGTTLSIMSFYGHASTCTATDSISVIEYFYTNAGGDPMWLLKPNGDGTITITA